MREERHTGRQVVGKTAVKNTWIELSMESVYFEAIGDVLFTAERAVVVLSPRAFVFGLQPMTVTGFPGESL
jgi:hypothetical protein